MKRFYTVLWIMCLVCLMMPAAAEDASDISGTDWVSPEDGYMAIWEDKGSKDEDLLLRPVDQENNYLYIDNLEVILNVLGGPDTGYRISMYFRQYPEYEQTMHRIPVVMTVERYNELANRMSGKDKKKFSAYKRFSYEDISGREDADELLAAFPLLATEDLYILRNAVPGSDVVNMNAIEELLESYGYTEADFEQDMSYVAVRPTWIEKEHAEKYITIRFQSAASDPTLTRSKALQLARLADTISRSIIANHIHPEGEPLPLEDFLMETYEVDGTVWHASLLQDIIKNGSEGSLQKSYSLIIDVTPE